MLAKLHTFSLLGIDGELALDGSTRPVKGALSMAMAAMNKDRGVRSEDREGSSARSSFLVPRSQVLRGIIVPSVNASETAVVEGLEVIAVDSLSQTVAFLAGTLEIESTPSRLDQLFQELAHHEEASANATAGSCFVHLFGSFPISPHFAA